MTGATCLTQTMRRNTLRYCALRSARRASILTRGITMDKFVDRRMIKQSERAAELHQKEREVLFENETLAVKVMQAVSGAAMIGGLTQAETLMRLAGRIPFLVFLTAMGLGLVAAVFTAHWKLQYKMWHVKGLVEKNEEERTRRLKRSNSYLSAMRAGMWISLFLITTGFLQLLIFLWAVGLVSA